MSVESDNGPWAIDASTTLMEIEGQRYLWRQVEAIVRSRIHEGVDNGADGHVLVVRVGGSRIIWTSGHSAWKNRLVGRSYVQAHLSATMDTTGWRLEHTLASGRFGMPLLRRAAGGVAKALGLDPDLWSDALVERLRAARSLNCTYLLKKATKREAKEARAAE